MAALKIFVLFACVLLAAAAAGETTSGAYLPSRRILQFENPLPPARVSLPSAKEVRDQVKEETSKVVEKGKEETSKFVEKGKDGANNAADKGKEAALDYFTGPQDAPGENLDALGAVGECIEDREECRKKLEEVEDCFDDKLGCASNKIKELLPDIDVTICDTDQVKAKFTDGGWRAYYGPRLWDSKSVATVVGFFFPATAAEAAETFISEMKRQFEELVEKVNEALAEVGDEASENLEDVMQSIFDSIITLDLSGDSFDSPNLDLKFNFLRVECENKVGTVEIPSEGYIRWGFGWRFKGARVAAGEGLPSDLDATASLADFNPARD